MNRAWRENAKCRGVDPDFFFQEAGNTDVPAFCRDCPVKQDCLEYSIVHDEQGWWGGLHYLVRHDKKIYSRSYVLFLREKYADNGLLEHRLRI